MDEPLERFRLGAAEGGGTALLRHHYANVAYIPGADLEELLQAYHGHTLGLVFYGRDLEPITSDLYPTITLDLPQLAQPSLVEVWTSPLAVEHYQDDECTATMNNEILFGVIQLSESETLGLDTIGYSAYHRILHMTEKLNYPNLLRIWNHFPAINAIQSGLERYQRFCIGRHRAFEECRVELGRLLPAATTVGTSSGILHVHFLAGRHKGQHVENPRQVSAYNYPRIYGPRSPSFARATLEEVGGGKRLFIAGTSSIVGHETRHEGNPLEQTKETLRNLEALIKHTGMGTEVGVHGLIGKGLLKVYVRNPDDLETVRNTLGTAQAETPSILYLKGDLCRRGLLVEIEGLLEIP